MDHAVTRWPPLPPCIDCRHASCHHAPCHHAGWPSTHASCTRGYERRDGLRPMLANPNEQACERRPAAGFSTEGGESIGESKSKSSPQCDTHTHTHSLTVAGSEVTAAASPSLMRAYKTPAVPRELWRRAAPRCTERSGVAGRRDAGESGHRDPAEGSGSVGTARPPPRWPDVRKRAQGSAQRAGGSGHR